jgi:hypothetical protein
MRLRRYYRDSEEHERRGLGRQMEEDSREAMHSFAAVIISLKYIYSLSDRTAKAILWLL